MSARAWALWALLVAVTAASAWATWRLRLSPDLASLMPDRGEAAALARYTRAFGGGDVGLFLVRGADAREVERAAGDLAEALRGAPSVAEVMDRAPAAPRAIDPTRAWLFAGPLARAKLARAVTPEGMRARLAETRAMLLAPVGDEDAEDYLEKDPLRLAQIPFEGARELAAGVRADEDGAFVADEGRARLVVALPRGSALESRAAAAFVDDSDHAIARVRAAHPGTSIDLAGGHAVARATEQVMRRDLTVSGVVSVVLASLLFVLLFRRARALVAVLPPLALGTLWTTGLAALWPSGLSAIAIAFMAVVVGVGVDTGVHVYGALLDARARGLPPHEAAAEARRHTWRPTMIAAIVAGLAFGSLALSDLAAVAQLGVLCGLGEVLTAVAILLVTPEIGAWLERGAPTRRDPPRWASAVVRITSTRRRAIAALVVAIAPLALLFALGPPRPGEALVALRPRAIAPLATQDEIYRLFGGRPGQWVVLSTAPTRAEAARRADAVAEALEPLAADRTIDGYDALATFLPAPATQRARLAARDALDLPARAKDLTAALEDAGLVCPDAPLAFERPSRDLVDFDHASQDGTLGWLVARHLATDATGVLAAVYVRASGDPAKDARALEAIRGADPDAVVTGYAQLERALRGSLARDLPRVGLLAVLVAAAALGVALRRARDVALALGAVVLELAWVALAMRVLHVPLHVYDALVAPVLVGITLDESMFLLFAARAADGAALDERLREETPLVSTTALTTAAGFGALLLCRFTGLADLGAVGALGASMGLMCALVVVPAGLRLARRRVGGA